MTHQYRRDRPTNNITSMGFKFAKITTEVKKRMMRKMYKKLERTESEEELDNSANEELERRIREGVKNGSIVLILPPPLCRRCQQKV